MANSDLHKLQQVEAEMLRDFKEFCEHHNLTYYLIYGTLLGAVRHKGFIPWDDDVDVAMPYDDYLRFLELSKAGFSDKYFVQTCDTDPQYYLSYAKVRKNNTTFIYKEHSGWNVHSGIWIDIFPLVEVNGGFEHKLKKKIVSLSSYLTFDTFYNAHTDEYTSAKGKLAAFFIGLMHKLPFKWRCSLRGRLMKVIFNAKNKAFTGIVWSGLSRPYPKECFAGTTTVLFEGEEYAAPKLYDKFLQTAYGDYMTLPPESERTGHGLDVIIDTEKHYTEYLNPKG